MKKALVIIDMQNDFVTGALGSEAAQAIVPAVCKKLENILESGTVGGDDLIKVIFTRDTHSENYLETQEGKNLPVPHCIEETNGWKIIKELTDILDLSNAMILDKPTFGSLELADFIKEINEYGDVELPDEIELCGLCTDICVVSNALILKTKFPETKIIVDSNATAGVTPESKNAALLTMKMCQVEVLNYD